MIPDYQTLMRPVLESVKNNQRKISDVVEEISKKFSLTDEERQRLLPSGKQTIIANRTHWAKTYLKQAGLVATTKRGWFEITQRGSEVLLQNSTIDNEFLSKFDEFEEFRGRRGSVKDSDPQTTIDKEVTPDEELLEAHRKLENNLAANLLDAARNSTPDFFEELIVQLFVAMGYGGSAEITANRLGRSGDNGVDGVINQDALGVDQIFLQAKRYAATNTVGAGEIRDFFGALNIAKATKGIFVTTSSFSPSAKQTVQDLGSRIVLVDGSQLALLMIKHNIGCKQKEVLWIKEIDEDFFEKID